MPHPAPVTMSPTLAADEALIRRRLAGEQVLSLAGGEIGLPVMPELAERLALAADRNAYGPVAGDPALRIAAAGYWERRGLATHPDAVVAGPGSKPLLFALMLAVGGDVVVPVPSWVSYAAQARLGGLRPVPVATRAGEGGVPDPGRVRDAVILARAAGHDPRCVVVTLPDNPTGTIASPATVEELAEVARELDLVIVSDEIYCDLVYDSTRPAVSPAVFAPERTVVTTGLTKSLAVGGWRLGVARLPEGPLGELVRTRLLGVASQIWSSTAAPVQAAAAWAFTEPPEVVAHVAAGRRLHETVVRAVGTLFTEAGAEVAPVRATSYLYPDFEAARDHLARVHGIRDGDGLAVTLGERYGVGVLPGSAFGEHPRPLRVRVATSRLYGESDAQRTRALSSADPLRLPWISASLERVAEVLADLTGVCVTPPTR
ncbi:MULTISPECIES: pyridoxal phosphate-dependent aminotransferase [Streptomyces]|uniref:Aminotransferase n=1 Tax=Streptomyces glycanivorans TaxID=3033808 RepID=A0ABY9JJD8_9ACTN|nr:MULTISPECIES: pyridoxal phosphate-dependent aminotransferase [unclassified Streptomyces]WSQ80663.1 pyridoxal phosphate-dependent aminotransferase [Streptomyces sp. NBC_01213]WLQ67240.1 pyridoxal phosphate-dependent aminotransferase [Streptomyces sp. Alt3]WSQ87995.1 pyridoxal phosphate-dependent aminotransferase [Streptomyces sp. NBC_01212]WSR05997.1 pyridoxal phosphate-dependent aminotransferase [Streptomyces sp. NBC_01208]WSR51395.1 pyridoxal phosphate-dependent aminotransferase [Streptomy